HLGRRNPDTTGFEHVVGPAEAAVGAVLVAHIGVPGTQPLTLEDLPGGLVATPVAGRGGRPVQVEIAGLARRLDHRAGLVPDLHPVTGYRRAGRARTHQARPVGQE